MDVIYNLLEELEDLLDNGSDDEIHTSYTTDGVATLKNVRGGEEAPSALFMIEFYNGVKVDCVAQDGYIDEISIYDENGAWQASKDAKEIFERYAQWIWEYDYIEGGNYDD